MLTLGGFIIFYLAPRLPKKSRASRHGRIPNSRSWDQSTNSISGIPSQIPAAAALFGLSCPVFSCLLPSSAGLFFPSSVPSPRRLIDLISHLTLLSSSTPNRFSLRSLLLVVVSPFWRRKPRLASPLTVRPSCDAQLIDLWVSHHDTSHHAVKLAETVPSRQASSLDSCPVSRLIPHLISTLTAAPSLGCPSLVIHQPIDRRSGY